MLKDNEYRAYYTVVGEFDPAEVTALIGLQPTESWIKGSRNEKTHHERKFSRWSLYSRLDSSDVLEKQLRDVLAQLLPVTNAVHDIVARWSSHIQLVGFFYTDYPGFGLEASDVTGLATLNLGFDCDFYYMYSDEREDS